MTTLQDPTENAIGPPVEADLCGDHGQLLWREYANRKPTERAMSRGVMVEVSLVSRETYGCGNYFQGHARGKVYRHADAKPEIHERARPLKYDGVEGYFYDADTGIRLSHVSILILQPGLHATYIP